MGEHHHPIRENLLCQNQNHRACHNFLLKQSQMSIKKGASVSEALDFQLQFRWINLINHTFKIRIINILKIVQI